MWFFLTTTSLRTQLEKSLFDYRDKRALVFNKDQVTAFDIKTSKNTYSLAKNGAQWDLLSPLEDKADDGKVQGVINRIANTRIKEFVDENPKSLATYGLLKPNYTIDVFIGSEKAKKTLYIGNAKAKQFYAKDETRKPVFLLDSSFVNIFKAPVSDYRNKKITDFKEADIARFELNYSDTTIVCTKDSNGKWVLVEPVKNKTKSWKISAITSAVANLRVEKFVDKKGSLRQFGLSKPSVIGTFYDNFGNILLKLELGKINKDNVYAKKADLNEIYLVNKGVMTKLTSKIDEISEIQKDSSSEATN